MRITLKIEKSRTKKKGIFKFLRDNPTNYFVQMQHFKLWKNIWLTFFVAALLSSVVGEHIVHWTIKDNLAEIISIKVAIIAFFGTLFGTANKNYRIYANLYDQTRFRSVVSKTIQSIILDDKRISEPNRAILLTVAAQSLFEMKANGHLTKKDSSSPVNDLLTALIARKDS